MRAPLGSTRAVGAAVRRTRIAAGVSLAELAAACNVSVRLVQLWESGGVRLLVVRLEQIERALGVPIR